MVLKGSGLFLCPVRTVLKFYSESKLDRSSKSEIYKFGLLFIFNDNKVYLKACRYLGVFHKYPRQP